MESQTKKARIVLILALDHPVLYSHVSNTAKNMARGSPGRLAAKCELFNMFPLTYT